jgi:hypothetical protein
MSFLSSCHFDHLSRFLAEIEISTQYQTLYILFKHMYLGFLQENSGFRKCYLHWIPYSMAEKAASAESRFPMNLFKLWDMPERRTVIIYSLVLDQGSIMNIHMIRLELHRKFPMQIILQILHRAISSCSFSWNARWPDSQRALQKIIFA